MNCIIIDDDKLSRAILVHMIKTHEELNLVTEFSNAIKAVKYLNQHEVELVFLDIQMPDFDGFDLMNTHKSISNVILVTSHKDYAIKAFEYSSVVDYLLKPIDKDRFERAVQKVFAKDQESNKIPESPVEKKSAKEKSNFDDFYINVNKRLIKIDVSSIYMIEAQKDYILIKTEGKNHLVHSSLKKIEAKLPQELFFKVHRSYIINIKKIIDIEYNSVLINKEVIPISRTKRPELMKKLNLL